VTGTSQQTQRRNLQQTTSAIRTTKRQQPSPPSSNDRSNVLPENPRIKVNLPTIVSEDDTSPRERQQTMTKPNDIELTS
jgi:hypothetical protein